jgi:porin
MTVLRAFPCVLILFTAITSELVTEPAASREGLFEPDSLTGDWGGERKQWEDAGIAVGITDVSETLSNPTGGVRQLSIYQGLVDTSLNLDLDKLLTWPGATFYIDGYWISGEGLSRNAIGNLLTVSTIEALASTRLHDMWLQQEFLDHQDSIRVGQIAIDDEFYISQYSAGFVNSTFGCPDILSTDLPSGGPCYPFAVPGARLRAAPTSDLILTGAVFTGIPRLPGQATRRFAIRAAPTS